MIGQILKLFLWILRIVVSLTLIGMLSVPFLLAPPPEALMAARAHSPAAALAPVGAGENQYTFLRLSDPTFLIVQLTSDTTPAVSESRAGMMIWAAFLALLTVSSWLLWRPRRTPPNNSFKPKPLRGSA